MDPFYAFLVFAVIFAFEQLASRLWVYFYYRYGIPIFFRATPEAKPISKPLPANLVEILSKKFTSGPLHPSLEFKTLRTGVVAMREKPFEHRGGVRYIPVAHTIIHQNQTNKRVSVIGYINWTTLAILVYLVLRISYDQSFTPVALMILFVLGLSFLVQIHIFNQIFSTANNLPTLNGEQER